MKYLFGAICAIVITMAFTGRKCDHVFTQVEQDTVNIERPDLYVGVTLPMHIWPAGIQEGKQIVCVKCFHEQRQILNYGRPEHGPILKGLLSSNDSCLFMGGGVTLTVDTIGLIGRKGRAVFVLSSPYENEADIGWFRYDSITSKKIGDSIKTWVSQ